MEKDLNKLETKVLNNFITIYRYLNESFIYNKKTKVIGLEKYRKVNLEMTEESWLEHYTEKNYRVSEKNEIISAQELFENISDYEFLSDKVSFTIKSLKDAQDFLNKYDTKKDEKVSYFKTSYIAIDKNIYYKNNKIKISLEPESCLNKTDDFFVLTKDDLFLLPDIASRIKNEYYSYFIYQMISDNVIDLVLKSYYEGIKTKELNGTNYGKDIVEVFNEIGLEKIEELKFEDFFKNQNKLSGLSIRANKKSKINLLNFYNSEENTYFLTDEAYKSLKKHIDVLLNDKNTKKLIKISSREDILGKNEFKIELLPLLKIHVDDIYKDTIWISANTIYREMNPIQKEKLKNFLRDNEAIEEIKDIVKLSSELKITENNRTEFKKIMDVVITENERSLIELYYADNQLKNNQFNLFHKENPLNLIESKIGSYAYFSFILLAKYLAEDLNIDINWELLNDAFLDLVEFHKEINIVDAGDMSFKTPKENYFDGKIIRMGKNSNILKILNPFNVDQEDDENV